MWRRSVLPDVKLIKFTYKSKWLLLFCTFSWPGLFCVSVHKNAISGFETPNLHWSIGRRSFTFPGPEFLCMGYFLHHIFQNTPWNESTFCLLCALADLVYSFCQDHSIKSLSLLCSYVAGRVQRNGICKVSMWGSYFTETHSLLKGPHNWDRRSVFQLTFSFPHSYYRTV